MEKILVPVDFSSHTEISCQYAVELATHTGAEIVLFHSFFEQIYFSDGGFATGFESGIMLTDEIILDFYKQKEKQLNELARKISGHQEDSDKNNINVSALIETGDPQIQILNIIEKLSPDLVIMGSSGLGKKGFLSGSVCKKTMDHTHSPIMAIPDIDEVKGFRNILYVTDIEQDDINALEKLTNLFNDFQSSIHCLHLNVDDKDQDAEDQMEALSNNELAKNSPGRFTFHVVSCRQPKTSLMDYIDVNEIELIAFIPHRKNFFSIFNRQDLTKGDLFETGLPILGILCY